jgi:hypothetical protein
MPPPPPLSSSTPPRLKHLRSARKKTRIPKIQPGYAAVAGLFYLLRLRTSKSKSTNFGIYTRRPRLLSPPSATSGHGIRRPPATPPLFPLLPPDNARRRKLLILLPLRNTGAQHKTGAGLVYLARPPPLPRHNPPLVTSRSPPITTLTRIWISPHLLYRLARHAPLPLEHKYFFTYRPPGVPLAKQFLLPPPSPSPPPPGVEDKAWL